MRTSSPHTIGRDAELTLLLSTLTELRARTGRAVFLLGDAGIGKSRLLGDCSDRAAELGVPVLRGRGSPTSAGTPFRPLVEALSSRFRDAGPPQDAELEPYRPVLARVVPEWRHTAGPGYPESVVELAEALLRLLAVLGRESGVVLALEDLHDADTETIAVVEYLVDNVAGLPVLLLATLRPEPGAALDLVRAAERRRAAAVLALRALDAPDVSAIAAGCLGVPVPEVPSAVLDRLAAGADGNPYVIEELLGEMVGSGALFLERGGWRVTRDLSETVPQSLVQCYGHRVGLLDPALREFLLLAATLGARFSIAMLQLITGCEDRALFAQLRSGAAAGLIVPDRATADQYAFRHALTAEALLASVSRAERAAIARQAARAVQQADPELSGDRCQLVAGLLLAAGDPAGAALLYAEAGRRALAAGASGSAVLLLERGHELVAEAGRADVTESLLYALAEAGQLDRAFALARTLPPGGEVSLDPERRIALHTRLAWVAVIAERGADTVAQVSAARALLGDAAQPERTAALAVVEGHLALLPGQGGPVVEAEILRVAEVAEHAKLPVVACQAWQLLALLARARGFDDADACLERMLAVAEQHDLSVWRVEALLRLGGNAFLRTGDARRLGQAQEAARGLGAIILTQRVEALLAMHAVQTGDRHTARAIIDRCLDASARMRNLATYRYLLVTSATLAAHRGNRREMEQELLTFQQSDGSESFLTPVVFGLCRTLCALLEEDRAQAMAELAAVADWERRHPNIFYLSGSYGLRPLLDVLAGSTDRAGYQAVAAAPAAELAWNRQFLRLADAVLLGREGRAEEAMAAVEQTRQSGGLFPTAHHLGLRLVAEAALADGWGDPVSWLRTASEYFHDLDVPPVVSACRSLLRQSGATVAQRRRGREQVPARLRAQGLTAREFEILALLVDRPGNQCLAQRLSISPRTVEKHIANLLGKTGCADRAALCELAVESTQVESTRQGVAES
ncbi:DNA-binding CsgD family transcriptional regulator/fructoselysine-6-P-deglycase FrlB-like protein [Kitasatospora sp. MAP12-15]|uniref:helix-turn-helix transcriptional regulator n=1 Tax=unclassified Kitasatospora TaxID=2633591 RepID=UPI002475EEFC|nr:LuxR family transcriptional regulator [Kitasatospora sp. MAP12-44]MDH6109623.1 DNA-binding CsgD family transcriptional regulator/fructoselysine-6-P-deglycase FrlB-like protein [Kitasatospora sp. MAP12-44]